MKLILFLLNFTGNVVIGIEIIKGAA